MASPAPELHIGDLETFVPLDCGAQHREPILRGRLHVVGLERRLGRGHEDEAIKPMLFVGILRRHQMTEVDGVEATAEKADFHRADRDCRARVPQGSIRRPRRPPISVHFRDGFLRLWLECRHIVLLFWGCIRARVAKWQTLGT